ncbi:hypothetical protein N9174_04245, partial [bacterium]|nr:hypothetical protein [bacterium]
QTMDQLLKDAEEHFLAQRYLIPANKNAYAVYQAILALDPQNAIALQRIEQMKAFYRKEGENNFKKGNWRKALSYFKRYRLIDPDAPDIEERVNICRKKLSEPKPKATRSKSQNAS